MSTEKIENKFYLLPASYGQERIWFFEKMFPNSATYNIPYLFEIKGELNPTLLKNTIHTIVDRHETLRTTIHEFKGEIMQKVSLQTSPYSFKLMDKLFIEQNLPLKTYIRQFALRPFSLKKGPLVKFELIKISTHRHILLMNVHHIIFDAWSIDIFTSELLKIYHLLDNNIDIKIEELKYQYADYANWEKERLQGANLKDKLNFWKKYLHEAPNMIELPTDYVRGENMTYKGNNIRFTFPKELIRKCRDYVSTKGTSLYSFFLAAFKILLYKYSGQRDIMIGSPISNRTEPSIQNIIGFFVNTVPIRGYVNPNDSFDSFFEATVRSLLEVYENGDVPFDTLVQNINPDRELQTHPFFQHMFTYHETVVNPPQQPFGFEYKRISTNTSKFDFVLYVSCQGDKGYGEIEFSTELFNDHTIHKLIRHYLYLIKDVLKDPTKSIANLHMLNLEERERLVLSNEKNYQFNLNFIHQSFEEQVRKNSGKIAVKQNQTEWTYCQLNKRANQFSNQLIRRGIRRHSIIGICMSKSLDQIAAILGVLKAGCAYLPIDPNSPEKRIHYMLRDAEVQCVITDVNLSSTYESICTIHPSETLQNPTSNINKSYDNHKRNATAYVIYTSGTTGKPKGVEIGHESVMLHIQNMKDEFPFFEGEKVLQNINYTFDPSVTEIFCTLLSGNALILTEFERQFDVEYLAEIIKKEGITRAQLFHSLIERLVEIPSFNSSETLRYVFTGGEALNQKLVEKYYQHMPSYVPLINLYGPTEACIVTSYYYTQSTSDDIVVPIGKPLNGFTTVILDENMQLVPQGTVGELYIAGSGLAKGYVNRPDLNKSSFHDLDLLGKGRKQRFYRTGDLVKLRSYDELLFITRKDTQIKIRGFRIELEEIKNTILDFDGISDVLIRVKEVGNEKSIYAFIIKDSKKITANQIRIKLKDELPYYMMPNAIVWIDQIPLQKNGKVDENQLPYGRNDLVIGEKIRPKSKMEKKLSALWGQLLGLKDVGINEDFFYLGGHSIKMIEVITYLRKRLRVNAPMSILFRYRTIEALAYYIENYHELSLEYSNIIPLRKKDSTTPPLYIIHPGGGGIACYTSLVRSIKGDIPIFGIQAIGYDQEEKPLLSITEMAERYVSEIKKTQIKGPYRLAGWSLGGTIAFEMVRIFEQLDDVVDFVGLIDAHPFEKDIYTLKQEDPLYVWARDLNIHTSRFETFSLNEKYAKVLRAAKKRSILPESAELQDVKRILNVMASNNIASDHYECLSTIQHDLVLFQCTKRDPSHTHKLIDPSDWQKRTNGMVTTIKVSGYHNNLMDSPYVEDLGHKMNQFL